MNIKRRIQRSFVLLVNLIFVMSLFAQNQNYKAIAYNYQTGQIIDALLTIECDGALYFSTPSSETNSIEELTAFLPSGCDYEIRVAKSGFVPLTDTLTVDERSANDLFYREYLLNPLSFDPAGDKGISQMYLTRPADELRKKELERVVTRLARASDSLDWMLGLARDDNRMTQKIRELEANEHSHEISGFRKQIDALENDVVEQKEKLGQAVAKQLAEEAKLKTFLNSGGYLELKRTAFIQEWGEKTFFNRLKSLLIEDRTIHDVLNTDVHIENKLQVAELEHRLSQFSEVGFYGGGSANCGCGGVTEWYHVMGTTCIGITNCASDWECPVSGLALSLVDLSRIEVIPISFKLTSAEVEAFGSQELSNNTGIFTISDHYYGGLRSILMLEYLDGRLLSYPIQDFFLNQVFQSLNTVDFMECSDCVNAQVTGSVIRNLNLELAPSGLFFFRRDQLSIIHKTEGYEISILCVDNDMDDDGYFPFLSIRFDAAESTNPIVQVAALHQADLFAAIEPQNLLHQHKLNGFAELSHPLSSQVYFRYEENDGIPVGQWKGFYSNGRIASSGMMLKGARHGLWSFNFRTEPSKAPGEAKFKGEYKNGQATGLWSFGRIYRMTSENCEFQDGQQHGKYTSFEFDWSDDDNNNPNQSVVIDGTYHEGMKSGTWLYYDSRGAVTKRSEFRKNVCVDNLTLSPQQP